MTMTAWENRAKHMHLCIVCQITRINTITCSILIYISYYFTHKTRISIIN